ncbi:hypothetical protein BTR23_22005 [Alkalihalophilus pseudofirmus]|nr:hypothetical protein BTR23_22005 [Alkalihalophilus pseudofirmus]
MKGRGNMSEFHMSNVLFKDYHLEQAIRQQLGLKENVPLTINNLHELEVVHAGHLAINCLEGIQQLKNVKELYLHDNLIDDLSPLAELMTLERLELGNNPIKDIRPLKNLKKLNRLAIGFNYSIDSIEPLQGLGQLKHLFICSNKLTDIRPLKNFPKLEWVKVCNNQISDISVLTECKYLKVADLSFNHIDIKDETTKAIVDELAGIIQLDSPYIEVKRVSPTIPIQ